MLILTVKTDQPVAEIGLYEDSQQLYYEKWQAGRQLSNTIHSKIRELLKTLGKDWPDIKGIIFFKGPGSFTGLRIGASVVNALAADADKPVVGTNGEEWITKGIQFLLSDKKDKNEIIVRPEYGSEPKTTNPVK